MGIRLELGIVVEMEANEKPKRKINRLWLHLDCYVHAMGALNGTNLD